MRALASVAATGVTLARLRLWLSEPFGGRDCCVTPRERLGAADLPITYPEDPVHLALDDRAVSFDHIERAGDRRHVADLTERVLGDGRARGRAVLLVHVLEDAGGARVQLAVAI